MKWFVTPLMFVLITGCSKNKDYDERSVQFIEELAEVVAQADSDCDKMADGVDAYLTKHLDLIKEINKYEEQHPKTEEQKERFHEKYDERMKAVGIKMLPTFNCTSDKKLQKAMKLLKTGQSLPEAQNPEAQPEAQKPEEQK